ncbi:hypothetical protein LT493_17100 [Streptomyces tricolor]|nr:hypothetical protein [Streptomyces tricolor]
MSIQHSNRSGTSRAKDSGQRWSTAATRRWSRRSVWVTGWTLAAGWAGFFPLFSHQATHRAWGLCAVAAYLCAAGAAFLLPRPGAVGLSVGLALTGAVALPLAYLTLTGRAQSEVGVIERAGSLLLHHGTPYLSHPRVVDDYTPTCRAWRCSGCRAPCSATTTRRPGCSATRACGAPPSSSSACTRAAWSCAARAPGPWPAAAGAAGPPRTRRAWRY